MAHDYDLIVIGAGAGGLTAAAVAVHLGAKTLLVEKARLGGDCTWTGCVPSKTLLHAAGLAHAARNAPRSGIGTGKVDVDFSRVMEVVRATRSRIYEEADSPDVFRGLGVHVRQGHARFLDSHTIDIDGVRFSGRFIVIAAGSTPHIPSIPGLSDAPIHTTETIFELTTRPGYLIVLGAGPVGIELAQAFRRLGSDVTVVDRSDRILENDEPELAAALRDRIAAEGVRFVMGQEIARVSADGARVLLELEGGATVSGDQLLVAGGRKPTVADLNLAAAGVIFSESGIDVDDRCRTNLPHVYADGDVTGRFQLTHMSEHMAKIAVQNALLKLPRRLDSANVPWVTFTDPELARVGASEAQLRDAGKSFGVFRFPFAKLDRSRMDGEPGGEVKILARRRSGRILGASVLGPRAGEMISELALAMRNGISLRQISDTIHPYPTYSLGVRRAADQWYVRLRSRRLTAALKSIMRLRGPLHEIGPDEIL